MNLNSEISKELWDVIEVNYNSANYSGAIIDTIFLLTETIRNKTGIEGDGQALVGQSFDGDNPKIKLNKLQTDSEKDIQKGIAIILRGIYTGIRNPRSHDKLNDSKEDADSIISFVSYLLKLIDKSKYSFNEEEFFDRIFDENFVETIEYAELLVNEVPKRQRCNLAINIILKRLDNNISKINKFMEVLISKLDENEIDRVVKVISDELKNTKDNSEIRTILAIIPGKYWIKIDKAVKIRTETILLNDILKGTYDNDFNSIGKYGALGTCVTCEYLENFGNKNDIIYALVRILESDEEDKKEYAEKFYMDKIFKINREKIHWRFKVYLNKALNTNDEKILTKFRYEIQWDEDHPWWEVFKEELKKYPDIKYEELPF
jgi:uncharacterized protein (TIGR02391 family)